FPERERDNAFVPRLWAAQRLGWLAAERRRHGGTPELDAEIRSLGERYGIPTEFSSYLVLEPGMQPGRLRADAVFNPVPSPAPMAATGAGEARFEQARQAAAQRVAKSLADVDAASEATHLVQRQVGTRQFVQQ